MSNYPYVISAGFIRAFNVKPYRLEPAPARSESKIHFPFARLPAALIVQRYNSNFSLRLRVTTPTILYSKIRLWGICGLYVGVNQTIFTSV